MPGLSCAFQIRSSLSGLGILLQKLGVANAMRVAADMSFRQLKGEPFKGMPGPEDGKEALSRRQAAPAIVLYRALKRVVGSERALDVSREIIIDASVIFLKEQVPVIEKKQVLKMNPEDRLRYAKSIADKFFNADAEGIEISDEFFRYRIARCRFPELMRRVGHEELAPLFCAGDLIFFSERQPDIRLERSTTLAKDAKPCDFNFFWR